LRSATDKKRQAAIVFSWWMHFFKEKGTNLRYTSLHLNAIKPLLKNASYSLCLLCFSKFKQNYKNIPNFFFVICQGDTPVYSESRSTGIMATLNHMKRRKRKKKKVKDIEENKKELTN